jgi:dephospho-CoA kinase
MVEPKRLAILGITGPIGCGKSTVAAMTRDLGALDLIDADRVTHELMQAGTELSESIGTEFGNDVLALDGAVDRRHLAEMVFRHPAALRRLEALVHPEVRHEINLRVDGLRHAGASGVVTIEAIRLLDSPIAGEASAIWLVECDAALQIERLEASRQYGAGEAERRIAAQPEFDVSGVSACIINDGGLAELKARVVEEWGAVGCRIRRFTTSD